MELIVITGMSGAGKSHAINILEDLGYYCVDNIPPQLIDKFLELCTVTTTVSSRIALVVDIRGGEMLDQLPEKLEMFKSDTDTCRLMYLDCADEAILRRYKETRRRHPLMDEGCTSMEDALKLERQRLLPAMQSANYYIDTTMLKVGQLRERIVSLLTGVKHGMTIDCISFGFKHGIPHESDFVMDLRSLPNPFYIADLKEKTGLDDEVYNYVFSSEQAELLYSKLLDMLLMLINMATTEGRAQFSISMGCTGGHHRSVSFARRLFSDLGQMGHKIVVTHRDIQR